MAEPAAFFGLRISPGEVYPLETLRDVHITNIAFGEKVEGSARSVVKVHHIKFPNLDDDDSDSEYDSDLIGDDDDDEDENEEDEDDEEEEDAEIKDAADADEEEDEEDEEDDEDDDSDSGGVEEEEFVVCSLYPGKIEQCSVNLYFSNLEDVGFSVTGDNDVELLGNYMSPSHYDEEPSDSELYDSDDDEEIDSDEEAFAMEQLDSDEEETDESRLEEIEEDESKPAKKALLANGNTKKRSNDEVDADESMLSAPATDAEIAAVAEAEGLDLSKLSKNARKRLNKKLKGDEGEAVAAPVEKKAAVPVAKAPVSGEKTKAKVEVTDKRGKKVTEEKEAVKKDGKEVAQKTKTASGLIIEDQKQGTGVAAKAGNRVGMRYVGRLQGKGTVFDSNTKGKPFFFKLGKGEVIKGWDEGVKGMKVGGERRLTCPPGLAYGRSGAPPTIPANATLVFDVKVSH